MSTLETRCPCRLIVSHPLLTSSSHSPSRGTVPRLGPGGFSATPQQLQAAIPYAVPAMLAGPGIAGLLLPASSMEGGISRVRTRLSPGGAPAGTSLHSTAPLLIMAVPCAVAHFADVPSADLHQRRHRLCC